MLSDRNVLVTGVLTPSSIAFTCARVAQELHERLIAAGVDVLLDDRDARAGVKFKDADLIGFPLRVVIGERGLKQGKLEIKWRWSDKPEMLDLEGAVEQIAGMIADLIDSGESAIERVSGKVAALCGKFPLYMK